MKSITIIGAGRVGGALAISLSRAGYQIDQLVYRSTPPAHTILDQVGARSAAVRIDQVRKVDSELVLITTGDENIAAAASLVAPFLEPGTIALHASGSLSSDVLSPLALAGCPTGSVHPLLSISDPVSGAGSFAGIYFCIEGATEAVAAASAMVETLGGLPFSIDTKFKPLYHAAAVMSAGHLTALFSAAADTLARCGLSVADARRALLPLLKSSVANLSVQAPSDALTGPFARGDVPAIERHFAAFDALGLSAEKRVYAELGKFQLKLAEQNGLDPEKAKGIARAIKLALESVR